MHIFILILLTIIKINDVTNLKLIYVNFTLTFLHFEMFIIINNNISIFQ